MPAAPSAIPDKPASIVLMDVMMSSPTKMCDGEPYPMDVGPSIAVWREGQTMLACRPAEGARRIAGPKLQQE
jgi:hypothetical protein